MARPLIYTKKARATVTEEMHRALQREAALTGMTPSAVVREALNRYFATPERGRRER